MQAVAKANNVPIKILHYWVEKPLHHVGSDTPTVITKEEKLLVAIALYFIAKCG